MPYLKQHRKATLELEGRKLKGQFDVSLGSERDRETLTEFINEVRKQLRDFEPPKSAPKAKKLPAKRKAPAKKKAARKKK